jgi:hypothetical protein
VSRATWGELLRRRRAIAEHEHALRTNDALFELGRAARREAQEHLNAGRLEEAAAALDEAKLYESATTRPTGS